VGAAVHARASAGRTNRDRAAWRITELGSAGVVGRQAWPTGDVGFAGRASSSRGAASGGVTRMGGRRTRRGTGRCADRPDLGRRAASASGSCAATAGGCAVSAAARPDVGRRPCRRRAAATPATTTTTTAAACASRSGAAAGRRAACSDVGISRACGRPAGAGLEPARGAIVGCRSSGAVSTARARLGRAGCFGRAGHATGAVME
jgi:hypothetical protein